MRQRISTHATTILPISVQLIRFLTSDALVLQLDTGAPDNAVSASPSNLSRSSKPQSFSELSEIHTLHGFNSLLRQKPSNTAVFAMALTASLSHAFPSTSGWNCDDGIAGQLSHGLCGVSGSFRGGALQDRGHACVRVGIGEQRRMRLFSKFGFSSVVGSAVSHFKDLESAGQLQHSKKSSAAPTKELWQNN